MNIDLDGVLYDFVGALRLALEARGYDVPDEAPDSWDFASWGLPRKITFSVMKESILEEGVFVIGKEIEGAVEGMEALGGLGIHRRIVTNKTFSSYGKTPGSVLNYEARSQVIDWLDAYQVPYETLVFTDSSLGKNDHRAHIVLDDKPDLSWVQRWPTRNLLASQPWNLDVDLSLRTMDRLGSTVSRVRSWPETVSAASSIVNRLREEKAL